MMANAPNPLQPTWRGHISSTMDALVLFEACLEGRLNHVPRRPHDREREELIRSGNVFIYEEHSSGIKRWTDGYNWSPSRILGNFLIYRELEKAFPPGEKKKAIKKKNKTSGGIVKSETPSRPTPTNVGAAAASAMGGVHGSEPQSDSQRALIGSLVDSYPFKEDGLVKKTISVHWNGVPHHLVSYYKVEDVSEHRLQPPSRCPELRGIVPRSGLISSQNFRVPVDQDEFTFGEDGRGWQQFGGFPGHYLADPAYQGMVTSRSYSVPNMNAQLGYPSSYALPAQPTHPMHTLPSAMSSNHYPSHPTNYGGFDPIRHAHHSRHSISNPGGLPGGLPSGLPGGLTNLSLESNTRRASTSSQFNSGLVTSTADMSALPATTMASSEPRSSTNYFPANSIGVGGETDYQQGFSDFSGHSYSASYMGSAAGTWAGEALHAGK